MKKETILRNSIPEPNTGCWLWTKYLNSYGYGTSGDEKVHRESYRLFRGQIPAGINVCHKCDTPACVNPDHLFLGTQRDNVRDMHKKKRSWQAKKTHCPKGHELSGINLMKSRPYRACIICHNSRRMSS